MARKPHLYWAVYGLILNENNEILMLKRQNTGYYDECFCLPSGHIESGETSEETLIHEMKEEISIDVTKEDFTPIAIFQRINDRQYFDIWYYIKQREGTINNWEPEKCSEMKRFWKDNIPENITPDSKAVIEHWFKHKTKLKYYIHKEEQIKQTE